MADHQVLIAGGGPTGLMLAAELALADIDVAIVERRPNQELAGSRAGGLHSRTIEIFDQRGIADRFLSQGQVAQVGGFAWIPLDISDFPTRHNYGLALWQNHIERILAEWIAELGVRVYRLSEVSGFEQDDDGVEIRLADGRRLRSLFLVGCDGGRSVVRKTAGIAFDGWDPTTSHLIAEVEMTGEPELGMKRDALGIRGLSRLENGTTVRVMVTEQTVGSSSEPSLSELSAALNCAYGSDFGAHSPTWISRFTDGARQASQYRTGRVFLAGDAAHVHPPMGGQGLNIGVQDAHNLGWKLALALKGEADDSLLDTYHSERHPVAARVLRNTLAQAALLRPDDRVDALRDFMVTTLRMDEPRRYFAAMISGLDVHYELGGVHPLVGRRMPDIEIVTRDGTTRVFSLMHDAGALLLNFGLNSVADQAPWGGRLRRIDATYSGAWELPVIGRVSAPGAVLIRPDGYVAWVGEEKSKPS